MEYSLMVIAYEYWPALLVIFFAGFLIRKRGSQQRDQQVARTTDAARQSGMNYVPPAGQELNEGVLQGTHHFSGTTRGVAWTADVTHLSAEADDGMSTRGVSSIRYTRWNAPGAGTGGGELMLMTLPDGVRPQPAQTPSAGFFGGLAAKAAWVASQVFIRAHFGNARAAALSLAPAHHRPLPEDAFGLAFTAFATRPELLDRLSPAARDWMLKGRDGRAAMLWDAQGLALTWPTARVKPDEVAALAEFGVVLAGLLVERPVEP